MPRARRRLDADVQNYLGAPRVPAAAAAAVASPSPRPRRRARQEHRRLLTDLERALERVQQASSAITVVGMRESDPVTYEIGDDAWAAAEALRRRVYRALGAL